MRNELNHIERIEKYLRNELSADEKKVFETELKTNTQLQQQVNQQKQVLDGLQTLAIKTQAKNAYSKFKWGKNLKKWGGIGGTAIVISAATFFAWDYITTDKNGNANTYELPQFNENGDTLWADADKYLPYQKFTINTSADTVIETEDGIVMAIPAGAFLDENGNQVKGNIELEVKEAIHPNDILKSGLSTKSGNNLLETGGMFYINARSEGKSLKIDPAKGIYTEVPTNEIKPGMQLFEGKRLANGQIDWVNPKPLEKFLVPVDIHSLNFYPPNYEDSLAGMSKDAKNKIYKDSLYYSFASLFGADVLKMDSTISYADSVKRPGPIVYKPDDYYIKTKPFGIDFKIENGQLTGKIEVKTKEQGDKIWEFCNENGLASSCIATYKENDSQVRYPMYCGVYRTTLGVELDALIGINPSKIKAFWDSKFNNTLLATREFEERLKYIHQTCNSNVLDIYVNNLDKKLCTLDSMAANAAGAHYDKFMEFAARGDGRIKSGQIHLEKLRRYYENKTKAYTQAVEKTEKEFWKKNEELREKFQQKSSRFSKKDLERVQANFAKELDINLTEAYRQIGKPRIQQAVYGFNVQSTGWKNLDKYVIESTLTRTTLDYTDPETGKKAVIKYEEFSATVKDRNKFDAVFVYVIPDQLDSYMRLDEENNIFSEKLNELFKHELVCVAYKGKKTFYAYLQKVSPGKVELTLAETNSGELDKKLKVIKQYKHQKNLLEEVSYRWTEQTENIRKKKVDDLIQFRERIQQVIFPCYRPK